MTHLTPDERASLFAAFARALFRHDMDALYDVVAPGFTWLYHDGLSPEVVVTGRSAILAHLEERKAFYSTSEFHDVAYHHLPDTSFMTFRVSETVRATGERREQRGIERYTFENGRIATKDVYRKAVAD